jgi:hypothetical protein
VRRSRRGSYVSGDPSQPGPARLRFLPAYFYPPTLFSFPNSSSLFTSLKISPTALFYPATNHLLLSSILLCILLCRSLALLSTGISPLYISQSELGQSHGFSLALYYRQQGQSFRSFDGANPYRPPFESHTPITLSLPVMNWLVPQSS